MSYVRKNQNLAIYPLENATAEFNLVLAEDGQTVSGSLEYGIHHNSEWHYDFVILMVREDMVIDTQLEGQARLVAGYVLTVARPFGGRDSEKI
ncbi:hypothetical protein HMPREF2753_01900 [Neisseria sp. HMSC071C03]|jgi:hypothetical protein|nr:hypothetical protein HMPREF3054_02395 [Neisseria sp. HMSC071B12]OHR50810.1 hypothetical protein HMPREF2753_01900 [Neisseria sp. HMSC071C03]